MQGLQIARRAASALFQKECLPKPFPIKLFPHSFAEHPGSGVSPGFTGTPCRRQASGRSTRISSFGIFPSAMEQTPFSHVFTGAEVSSMHKFTLWLAAAILMTAALTARMPRTAADDSIHGDWSAKFNEGSTCGCFNLEVERSSWGHHNTWGNTHKISDFVGLDANFATAKDSPVHFEMRRDAGIMNFDGRFHNGEGKGKFSFAANSEYVQGMKSL